MVALREGKVDRNRLMAGAHLQLHAVVLAQKPELLQQVVAVQVGPRQGGFVTARAGGKAVGQALSLGLALHGLRPQVAGDLDAHIGVAGAHPTGQRLAGRKARNRLAQVAYLLVVDLADLGQRLRRVVVVGGSDEGRCRGHGQIVPGSFHRGGASGMRSPPQTVRQRAVRSVLSDCVLRTITLMPDVTENGPSATVRPPSFRAASLISPWPIERGALAHAI